MRRLVFLLWLIFSGVANVQAQSATAAEYLKSAKDFYNLGKVDSVIFYLESKDGEKYFEALTSFEQSEWLRLLFASYISTDQYDKSQVPIKKFLRKNPFYEPTESDPLRLKYALDSMEVEPTLMIGIRFGATRTLLQHLGSNRYVFERDFAENKSKEHNDSYGYLFGVQFEYNFSRILSVNFAPTFEKYHYDYRMSVSTNNPNDLGVLRTRANQDLFYITLPVLLRARMNFKDAKIYGQAGFFTSSLSSALRTLTVSSSILVLDTETSKNFHATNSGYIVGVGAMLRRRKITFNADLRFCSGFGNIIARPNYYETLAMDYYDIPDDIRLRGLELSFGLFYNFKYKVYDKKK